MFQLAQISFHPEIFFYKRIQYLTVINDGKISVEVTNIIAQKYFI